jgi:LL-diaminopimelate aminotransferase
MTLSKPFIRPSDRIASFKPYYFATLNLKLAELKSSGVDIIRIDIGSPDLPPAEFIIDTLVHSARRPDTHGYTANGGSLAFREAIARYYKQRFMVDLNPQTETLALLGSKEGIFNLNQVWVNPGEIVLVPDPGYPVYRAGGLIAGAQIYPLPILQKNKFLPDLETIPKGILKRTKLLWLNFPNNPTGAVAPLEFFEKAIGFAKKYQFLIAHDAPYTNVCFDGYIAPSILQVQGAKEVCIEFNSLSKSYNLAGWRLGMAVGNPDVIHYLHTYKSQSDSSHFEAILQAGITAMTGDQSWINERNAIYQQRRDIMVRGLRKSGFSIEIPQAAIYIWAFLPPGYTDSLDFSMHLLQDTGVSVTPGIVYGGFGEGYIRISISAPTSRLEESIDRIAKWLAKNPVKG